MTEEEDIDGLAAEYVLGSLNAAERTAVDVRRRTDAALEAAIAAWQRRLAPLGERDPAGDLPPPQLFEAIAARIAALPGPQSVRGGEVVAFPGRRRRLAVAVSAGALAACLAVAAYWLTHGSRVPHGVQRTQLAQSVCGGRYKDFWVNFDRSSYGRMSAEQLAGLNRMALRAYDACEAGDEQDAKALFDRLKRMTF